VHAFSRMLEDEDINQWARWNAVRRAISFILSLFSLLVIVYGIFNNVTLIGLLPFEAKIAWRIQHLYFTQTVINGKAELSRPSLDSELVPDVQYRVDKNFDMLLLSLRHSTPGLKLMGMFFYPGLYVLIYPSMANVVASVIHLFLNEGMGMSIPFDWAYNTETLVLSFLIPLLIAASFYEAKLSKPIYNKILSLK